MSKEPREFWIEIGGETLGGRYEPDSIYLKATRDTVHVIEYSAYETLTAKVKRYEEALLFYANQDNWIGYHRDCTNILNDDVKDKAKEDGFDIIIGGKRARAALNQKDDT